MSINAIGNGILFGTFVMLYQFNILSIFLFPLVTVAANWLPLAFLVS
jgi:hypothetical protein